MVQSLKPCLLTTFFILASAILSAQTLILKQSNYYKPGQSQVSQMKKANIKRLVDSLSVNEGFTIVLEGNSDIIGNYDANKKLSEKRALACKYVLINAGVPESIISVKALGSDNPVASNKTKAGRKLNRRVEILFFKGQELVKAGQDIQNISALYEQLKTPLEIFCINQNKDTVLRCKKGTVIYLKANSLIPTGDCGSNCISFRVREDFLKSDMVLDNLSTTSNGEIIETQGMIYTEAVDCRGNMLEMQQGKDMVIVIPTDSVNPTAKIFDGNRSHDSIMNWTVSNNPLLSSFTQEDFDICGGWICASPAEIIDCAPCKFFFCRIGRVGKATLGLVSKGQHARNVYFRQCQEKLTRLSDPMIRIISSNPTTVVQTPPIEASMLPTCEALEALFKKYGVNNIEKLILAINKPLLDSFGVSTIAELKDTMGKVNRKNIELSYLNKKVSFDDFKYYIYNNSKLGWSNVDCFANIPEHQKITLRVNINPAANIDCKLVFKKRRFVIPAAMHGNIYQFKGVPKGEQAMIVAIKYEYNQPFLAMQEVMVDDSNFDVAFKALTLEELKLALKQLD